MKTNNKFIKLAAGLNLAVGMLLLSASGWAQWNNYTVNSGSVWDPNNWVGGQINGFFASGTNGATTVSINTATYSAGSNVIYTGTYNAHLLSIGTFISGAGIPGGAYVTGIDNAGRVTISAAATVDSNGTLTVTNLGNAGGYGTVNYRSIPGSFNAISGILTLTGTDTVTSLGAKVGQNLRGPNSIEGSSTYAFNTNIVGIIDEKHLQFTGVNGNDRVGDFEFTILPWSFKVTGSGTINGDFIYRNKDPWVANLSEPNSQFANINFAAQPSGTVNVVFDTNNNNFTWGDRGRTVRTDFGGQAATFNISPRIDGMRDLVIFRSSGSGMTALTKTGLGGLRVDGNSTQNLYLSNSGVVRIEQGVISLYADSQLLTGARIQGAGRYDIVGSKSALYVDVSSVNGSQAAGVNLIEAVPVNLYAGELIYSGNGASLLPSQTAGAVNLYEGRAAVGFGGVSNAFTLTLDSLNRKTSSATVNFAGLATAGNARLLVTNTNSFISDMVGKLEAAGNAGAKNLKILPWATVGGNADNSSDGRSLAANTNVYNTTGLVTYEAGVGFRVLSASEYQTDITTASTDENVRLGGNATLAGNKTVNSLSNSAVATLTVGSGNKLTVTSGVVASTNGALQVGLSNNEGYLDSGAGPLYLYGNGSGNDLIIKSVITNSATGSDPSVIISNYGRTFIDSANSYQGATIVQGVTYLRNSSGLAISPDSAVRVDSGGRIQLDNNNGGGASLAGLGQIAFNGSGLRFSVGGSSNDWSKDLAGYVTVHDGSFLAPGDADGLLQVGEFTLGTNIKGLRFMKGAIFDLDVAGDLLSDRVVIGADNTVAPTLMLDNDAIVRLNFLNGYTPDADTQWLLTTGFTDVSGNLENVLLKDSANQLLSDEWSLLAFNGNLLLSYSAIPEPSVWALLLAGATTLAFTLRRLSPQRRGGR